MPVSKSQTDARKTALFVLNTMDKGQKRLDIVLDDAFKTHKSFPKRERAQLQALVYGVQRWRAYLDWIIKHFSNTPIRKIEPGILNILRLGLFQIVFLDRIPDSAAVNTSVEMSKTIASQWTVRFVNALLRKAAKAFKTVTFPDHDKNPVAAIAIKKSFPEWMIKRWIDRFGPEKTETLCDMINTIPPITMRVNTLKTTRERLHESIDEIVDRKHDTSYSPDGISVHHPRMMIPEIPAFKDGWFQVQDEAAQLITYLLDPQSGETILDACAGLGGKTGHIVQMMKNLGSIIAADNNADRLRMLESDTGRLGMSIAKPQLIDLTDSDTVLGLGVFDRILLDAPCSGLGVLRRHPDAKWRLKEDDLQRYKKQQIKLINNLAPLVKPLGILNYTVCSNEPEENEEVIDVFLAKHPEFIIVKHPQHLPSTISSLIDRNGYFRTWPDLHSMDGFFSINLKRQY